MIKFIVAYFHEPQNNTLLKTVQNNNLITWPSLTATNFKKHMEENITTSKGHLDWNRKNIRSTKSKNKLAECLESIKCYEIEEDEERISLKHAKKPMKHS